MNLSRALAERDTPVRVGLIGAGKFGTMFLASARRTRGLEVAGVADLAPERARAALERTGWASDEVTTSPGGGGTWVTDDAEALTSSDAVDVVIEATGIPAVGVRHVLLAIEHGRHVVNVTVEADALVGPLLAARARAAGVVYSLAYGDQPALIWELVDWARTSGFEVVCAGKGTKFLPGYHQSTPDTVWEHYGFAPHEVEHLNAQMFNSFLDGTKSAIEMASVANATGLLPAAEGLAFPPAGVPELAQVLKPREHGGELAHSGTVEVVSSLRRDGSEVEQDLRWGVFVVVDAGSDYVAQCFGEYGARTDDSGRYHALHRPYHYIGLELGVSVASAALLGEPTGAPLAFHGDVSATAKRALRAGERLDGEGGSAVYGALVPAAESLRSGHLPIGLTHGVELVRDVEAGAVLTRADVSLDSSAQAVRVRGEMEREAVAALNGASA